MSEPPHKIEILLGQDYAAQFPKTEPEDLPTGCILPEELHSIPTLPPTDVELPKECTWIVEPPIPEPYVCVPTVGIDIDVSVCSEAASKGASVSGGVSIGADPNSECGLLVSGGYEICMCIPEFRGGIDVNMCPTGSDSGATADSSVQVTPYGECGYQLSGGIDICIPCIPQVGNSDITFVGTGLTKGGGANISLVRQGECDLGLEGTIVVNSPCITAIGTVSISPSGDVYGGAEISLIANECGGVMLSGSGYFGVTLPEPPAAARCTSVVISAGEPVTLGINLKMGNDDVGYTEVPLELEVLPKNYGCSDIDPISAVDNDTGQTIQPGCCGFDIKFKDPGKVDVYLGFSTADITLCNSDDGSTTDLTVLTMPPPAE